MPDNKSSLTGVLLAAGMGTRLKDLTANKPKALVEVAGRPLFAYAVDFLRAAGAGRIVVVVGSHAAAVRAAVSSYAPDAFIVENARYRDGNLYSVAAALPEVSGSFLLCNVDHIYAPPIPELVSRQCGAGVVAFCDQDRALGADDMKVWSEEGRIRQISKALPLWNRGYVGLTYCGEAAFPAYCRVVEEVFARQGDAAVAENVVAHLADTGVEVSVGDISGVGWHEVDTPEERQRAEEAILADPRFLKAPRAPGVSDRPLEHVAPLQPLAPRRRICVFIINRANYGRLKPLLTAIRNHPNLELQIVVGSSMLLYRFGKGADIMEADGFRIDARVYMHVDGENPETMAKSIGLGLVELPGIFGRLKPDIVLVNADRYETLVAAIAAASMNIPVAHTLGGEITGTIDESIRHAVTKLAHLHFPAHDAAARRIVQMGEDPDHVHRVGNPALDVIAGMELRLDIADFWKRNGGVGQPIDLEKPYILCVQHPVTSEYGKNYSHMLETLEALDILQVPVILLWPNNDAGSDEVSKAMRFFRENRRPAHMHFFRTLSVEDFIRVLANSHCIVGNSSSGIMEAGFLGIPAVNVGTRQAGRERGVNVIDVGCDRHEIALAVRDQMRRGPHPRDTYYGDGCSAERIVRVIAEARLESQKQFIELPQSARSATILTELLGNASRIKHASDVIL